MIARALICVAALGAGCGGKVDFVQSGSAGGAGASSSGSKSTTSTSVSASTGVVGCVPSTIDTEVVRTIIAEGERAYYVTIDGRIMSADLESGVTTSLTKLVDPSINIEVPLAVDDESLYFGGSDGLSSIPKGGGAVTQIIDDQVDNVIVDATGVYWTRRIPLAAEREVFRRRPDGSILSLGTVEAYNAVPGIFHGSSGLIVPGIAMLVAFDIEGSGATVLAPDLTETAYPFEAQGMLYFSRNAFADQGLFGAAPDGSGPKKLYPGPVFRALTDGVFWVLADEKVLLGATFPDGPTHVVYDPGANISPRSIALTPTRLLVGGSYWDMELKGLTSLCRSSIGL